MKEFFEEYGEFVVEAVSGALLLGILAYFFLGSPMTTLIHSFIISVNFRRGIHIFQKKSSHLNFLRAISPHLA